MILVWACPYNTNYVNIGGISFCFPHQNENKIATMYDPQIIYDSKKRHPKNVETQRYIQMHNYGTGVWYSDVVK